MGRTYDIRQADRQAQILPECLNAQHHTRNGCMASQGLIYAMKDNLARLDFKSREEREIALQMAGELDLLEEQINRIGEAIRGCGK